MKWLCVLFVLTPTGALNNEFSEPQNITSNPCTDSNHLFLAPGVLTAGGTNRACVSRFDPEGPARMVVSLVAEGVQAATAFRELPPGDGGCVDITVPQKPNTKAELVVNLRYPEAKCSWEREVSVLISAGRVVVVHTERARYRAGDTLRARVIALKPDLTPAHGMIDEVWVEGPRGAWEGSRAVQWLRVRTRMGIAQVQHDLDELAPAGRWTIRAKLADGSQGSAVFWVGGYELPPFQLSVRHAPRVLRTSERLVWTVCVRYPWTEAVEGMLVIRIRGAGGTTVAQEPSSSIKTVVRIKAPRACHRHAAAARRIGVNGSNRPDVVVADFSFQEDGTRIWQNTTVVSQVVDQPVSLEFLRKLRAVISPGLPYKLKVKATRWDDKPAANEHVRVCRTNTEFAPNLPRSAAANDSCHDAVTDDRGIARVTFTATDDGSAYFNFQASLQNDSSVTAAPLHLPARHSGAVHASLGPIKPSANSARTFVPLYINLRNVSKPITVHFVVITRGGIIYRWGATTQCPLTSSSDYIPTTSRNSQCYYNYDSNSENYQTNVANSQSNAAINETIDPDSLLDRHLLRVMLPIKVTHQMCPDSHLVAFFYYNGELVSASKQFEMDECFSNKVEATWQSRQVAPGSTASMRVSTPGPALCALSVVDSASKWSQPAPSLKELVMSGLRRLMDSHRNLTEYEAAGACFRTSDVPELPTNSRELTATWLAAAGVRVTGGHIASSQQCVSQPSPLMDEVTIPRSDFSEAWLWRLAAVGTNGSSIVTAQAPDSISRFEATAVCLARTGIAVSPPAVLQVFREFFIHADGPRRLRRGDATIIRYRLFNYLYEPLSVQIQILTDAHLEGPVELVESACIAARASVARRVEILARVPGHARLSIRAKSVRTPDCGNTTLPTNPVSDEVIITIEVDPEGVPVEEHKSILLCGRGSPESSRSEVSWSWPPIQSVPGTEALTVWAVGDVKGPLLFDADGLVTLPRGCGEQNMARLAANLLALQHLHPDSPAYAIAKEHVARGFTRQLQYIHGTGGFSAFGAADASPSTWLTAFSLKYLRRAHQILNPELPVPPALERAERWLLSQQMENGCFRNEGQVFHSELRGGLNEDGEVASVALTAYVITALVDSTAPLSARVLHNTVSCLRALPPMKTRSPTRVYAHALLGYAFMRLRSYEDELRKTNEASLLWDKKEAIGAGLKEDEELRELMELLKMARRSGDYVWWETSSLGTSVEATAYALLALAQCPPALRGAHCAADARAAVRWLSAHRNHAGGFLSTQDTLVALEALSSWTSVQPSAPPNLTVRMHSGGELKKLLIQPDVKVPDVLRLVGKSQVDVSVEGTGCALVQATRSYNTLAPDQRQDKLLTVQVSVHTDGAFNCDVNGTNCFCAAVVELCVSWSGAFPAMAVAELALPAAYGADASRLYSLLQQPDTLLRRVELTPNGGRATLYLASRDGTDSGQPGHRCFPVHAVGPRTRTKPAHVRVLDYYTPTINDTQMFTIPEDCPPRISHSTDEYLRSDNLFNKAKSLTDSSEILITHEFSFDDIPEGIPLEDPLYDLGRDDVAYLTKYNKNQHDQNKVTMEQLGINLESNDYNDTENDSGNFIKTAVKKQKVNDNIKDDIPKSMRKGHSIPFVINYPKKPYRANGYMGDYFKQNADQQHFFREQFSRRNYNVHNTRMNDFQNAYLRKSVDQTHLYPEQFYDTNYFPQRTDHQNNIAKLNQEKIKKLYNNDNFKENVTETIAKSEGHDSQKQSANNGARQQEGKIHYEINDDGQMIIPLAELNFGDVILDSNYEVRDIKKQENRTSTFYPESRPLQDLKNVGIHHIMHSNVSDIVLEDSSEKPLSQPEQNTEINNPRLSTKPLDKEPEISSNQKENGGPSNLNFSTSEVNLKVTDARPNKDSQSFEIFQSTPGLPSVDLLPPNYGPPPSLVHSDSSENDYSNSASINAHSTPGSNSNPISSNTHTTSPVPQKDSEVSHYSSLSNSSFSDFNNSPSNLNQNLAITQMVSSGVSYDSSEKLNAQTSRPAVLNPNLSYEYLTNPGDNTFINRPNSEAYLSNTNVASTDASHMDSEIISGHSNNNNGVMNNPSSSFEANLSHLDQTLPNVHKTNSVQHNKNRQPENILENPNLSNFHIIDSETDLEVPSGMEGPIPAVALPPQNFVAVAPPPGFRPPFPHGGYPRHYPLPIHTYPFYWHETTPVK